MVMGVSFAIVFAEDIRLSRTKKVLVARARLGC